MFKISIFLFGMLSLYGDWTEEVLKRMTVQEKIGQLFIIPACPRYENDTLKEIVKQYHIGSVLVKQGHPLEQISLLIELHQLSIVPLLVVADAEWGLGMRLEETLSFPRNNLLGQLEDKTLIYDVGRIIGEQCRSVGIHLNFSPVVDINNNPANLVIGNRSFGSDPTIVAHCGVLMIKGLQQGGTMACAKHFPGHGDTQIDSHQGLPMISHSRHHLENVEFVPFKEAITAGVDAVMTGHLLMPALDPKYPTTLSYPIVTTLLQKEWGFKGLIITDALNMKALSQHYPVAEIALKAFLAGHDLLLYGAHLYEDVNEILTIILPVAYSALLNAYEEGVITDEMLNQRLLKILKVKKNLPRKLEPPKDLMRLLNDQKIVTFIEKLKGT